MLSPQENTKKFSTRFKVGDKVYFDNKIWTIKNILHVDFGSSSHLSYNITRKGNDCEIASFEWVVTFEANAVKLNNIGEMLYA